MDQTDKYSERKKLSYNFIV